MGSTRYLSQGKTFLVVVLVLFVPTVATADVVVDSFNFPGTEALYQNGTAAGTLRSNETDSSILGSRSLSISTGLGKGDFVGIGGGSLEVGTFTTSLVTTLTYNFAPSQNFAGAGDALSLSFNFLDSGPTPPNTTDISINITTGSGTLTTTASLSDVKLGNTTSFSVPFSSFSGTGDLTNVTQLQIELNDSGTPRPGVDLILNQVSIATPEPTSLLIWGLVGTAGAAGSWYIRQRKRQRISG